MNIEQGISKYKKHITYFVSLFYFNILHSVFIIHYSKIRQFYFTNLSVYKADNQLVGSGFLKLLHYKQINK